MKKYKVTIIIFISVVIVSSLLFGIYKIFFDKPYVYEGIKYDLTEEIAIQIGKIILLDAFPEEGFNEETQFCAVDQKDSWMIWNVIEEQLAPEGFHIVTHGGRYSVEIKKSNGEILNVKIHD